MNRNPGYRHLLLGAAALFTLSAILPLACAEPEADLTAAGGSAQEAGPDGAKEAGTDASKGGSSSGGSSGKGGSNSGGSSGKGGSNSGGSTGYGGYAGTGTGGDSGSSGSTGSSGSGGGGGSAMYARPLGEGEQSCTAGQIFIFGSCFP